MADGFRVDYEKGLRRLSARFGGLSKEMDAELQTTVTKATDLLYEQARDNVRSMFKTSGKMENALRFRVRRLGPGRVVGSVSIRGIGYLTQERGGLKPYTIYPKSRNALRFFVASKMVFSMYARRLPLPRRSYLAEALHQKRSEIRALFDNFARRALDRVE